MSSDMSFLEVRITAPPKDADRLARTLVEERLAACVQSTNQITSTYVWQDKVTSAVETLLVAKTSTELFDRLAERVTELHSYEVPEVVAVPLTHLTPAYAAWLAAEVVSPS